MVGGINIQRSEINDIFSLGLAAGPHDISFEFTGAVSTITFLWDKGTGSGNLVPFEDVYFSTSSM